MSAPARILTTPTQTSALPEAHRLQLSGRAWTLLLQLSGVNLPPEFTPGGDSGGSAVSGDLSAIADALNPPPPGALNRDQLAEAELAEAGALQDATAGHRLDRTPGPPVDRVRLVHPSVLANLAVLDRPRVLIRVECVVPAGRRLALIALTDALGATLIQTSDDGGVELSLFSTHTVSHEITRLLPPLDDRWPTDTVPRRIRMPVSDLHIPAALAGQQTGELLADVLAILPGPAPSDDVAAGMARDAVRGRVVWMASDNGWIGVRPVPDGSSQQPVELTPVHATDLPGWLAPLITIAWEATSAATSTYPRS